MRWRNKDHPAILFKQSPLRRSAVILNISMAVIGCRYEESGRMLKTITDVLSVQMYRYSVQMHHLEWDISLIQRLYIRHQKVNRNIIRNIAVRLFFSNLSGTAHTNSSATGVELDLPPYGHVNAGQLLCFMFMSSKAKVCWLHFGAMCDSNEFKA